MNDVQTVPLVPEDTSAQVAAVAVAASAIGWWPAFTMGVYGVVFFEQHLALWAAATAAFLALAIIGGRRAMRRPAFWALLLPSLWLVLVWLLPVGGDTTAYQVMFWMGIVVTVFGIPALVAFMVRLLIPGAARLHRRQAVVVLAVVASVMGTAFLIGTQHPRMLTCEDFSISGNFAPPNCSTGTGTTVRSSSGPARLPAHAPEVAPPAQYQEVDTW